MADRIRFHLDEHVDPAIAAALRRAGIDVTTTIQAGLRTEDDKSHFRLLDLPPEVFAKVILAHWMTKAKKTEIVAVVKAKYPQVELCKAKLNETDLISTSSVASRGDERAVGFNSRAVMRSLCNLPEVAGRYRIRFCNQAFCATLFSQLSLLNLFSESKADFMISDF